MTSTRLLHALDELLASPREPARPSRVLCAKLALARAAEAHLGAPWAKHIDLFERVVTGKAEPAELLDAQREVWASVTGMACGVTQADSQGAQVILLCLEVRPELLTKGHLAEVAKRVMALGVSEDEALGALAR